MDKHDNDGGQFSEDTEVREAFLTLDDLLSSSSDALNRIARDLENDGQTTAHQSYTSGHRSSGAHNSHSSSSQIEQPLT